jgi:O-antigen ligase
LAPAAVTWFALVVGAALCAVSATRSGPPVARDAAWTLVAASAFFVARGAMTTSPAVSLLGTLSQHNGAALWVAAACWFVAASRLATRETLRRTIVLISIAGAAYTAATGLEVLTSGAQRSWGSAAGVFENSSSLGQFLALAVLASVAWGFLARTRVSRALAGACGAVSLAGLALSQSRAGLLGVVAGLAVALAALALSRARFGRETFSLALPASALSLTTLAVAASSGSLGARARSLVGVVGTERDVIWRSALAAFRESPLVGRGLEQFSAWVSWSYSGGRLAYNATYDPHNALLAVAVGGGAIGLALALTACVTLLASLADALARSGRSRAIAFAIGAAVAAPASGLVTWFSPVAVVAASLIAGSVIGATDPQSPPTAEVEALRMQPRTSALLPLAALALAAALAAYTLPGIIAETRYAIETRAGRITPESLEALSSEWPDPAYASMALNGFLDRGAEGTDAATALAKRWRRASTWHVDLALGSEVLAGRALATSMTPAPEAFSAAVEDARRADPASGIWDFVAAVDLERLGDHARARAYAKRALRFDLNPEARSLAEQIAR